MATTEDISKAPPCVAERYNRAASTSRLIAPDEWRPTDAYVLVASGLGRKGLGGALLRLQSEWSRTARPNRIAPQTVGSYAARLPRIYASATAKAPVLDFAKAKQRVEEEKQAIPRWHDAEIRMLKHKLATMPQVRDHLTAWAWEKAPERAEDIVAQVLLYWLDKTCQACNGTKWQVVPGTTRQSNKRCECCRGTGEQREPQGLGQKMYDYIGECIYDWRQSTKAQLRNMSGRAPRPLPTHVGA